jgi:DNA-3-methyladenine glycosylase
VGKRLKREFFIKPTLEVAKSLLGKVLVRIYRGKRLAGKIVETEAYIGPQDKASHAYLGKRTPRNRAEFMVGGHLYIYLVYGMYWQLNISTETEGKPTCVLIRALQPIEGIAVATNGPGKLCRALRLNGGFYGEDLCRSKRIWLEEGGKVKTNQIVKTSRVGIDYAGSYWSKIPWRFYIKDNKFVSKTI